MTTPSSTESQIIQFLRDDVAYDRDLQDLSVDDNLLDGSLLDSLAILKVVTFCEEQFAISIPDHEVLPDNMESVRAIAALVERLRGAD